MAEKTIGTEIVKVIEYLVNRLEDGDVAVSKIVVFGSQITGAAGGDSDIDLIIVSESFRGKDLFERAALIGDAYEKTVDEFLIPMDIVMETPEEFNPDFGLVVYAA